MNNYMSMTEAQWDQYWGRAMERRQPDSDEVGRLVSVLLGFYHRSLNYATTQPNCESHHPGTLEDFWDSKRPYGNKDIEWSIAYNLGWDYARNEYQGFDLPTWVRDEAARIHNLVLEEIKDIPNEEHWRL